MIRTQIQLTEDQARELKDRARREQRSMADLIRESVTEYLIRRRPRGREAQLRRAVDLAGAFRSREPDLADDHDRHLDEAFGEVSSDEAPGEREDA